MERFWASGCHLVRDVKTRLVLPVHKRIQYDFSGVDGLVDERDEQVGLVYTQILRIVLRPVLRFGKTNDQPRPLQPGCRGDQGGASFARLAIYQ